MANQGYLLTCLTSGLTCYFIFKRFEPNSIRIHFFLLVATPLCLGIFCYIRWNESVLLTVGTYLGTLVASVVVYRLSPFHPLASIPGETSARISRLRSSQIIKGRYQHLYYHKLFSEYGPFIRIGPNHITTTEASAIPTVLGAGPFRKSDRYVTFVAPGEQGSLLSVVDPHLHAERRRLWEPIVTSKALQEYKEVMQNRIQQLVSLLLEHQGEDLNLSTWFSYFSFDIMGDIGFDGQFDVMQSAGGSGDFMENLKGIKKALHIQDYMMVFTWLREYIPLVPQKYMKAAMWLRNISREAVVRRVEQGSKTRDFFYHLLKEGELEKGSGLPLSVLIREAILIIPAGYDSTANAITHAFFHLLTNPVYFEKLRDEVDQTFSNVDEIYFRDDLQNLPYLNAVINEILRLTPPLASGTQRYLPKGSANGGVMLGDKWIPEGTYVQIHTYSMHRNPKYFSPEPEVFRPERWLDNGYHTDKSAFIPFSYGPANCIGKQIALIKLRKTLCILMKSFNFELSPQFDINKWNEDVTDQFTLGRGDLLVRIQKRV